MSTPSNLPDNKMLLALLGPRSPAIFDLIPQEATGERCKRRWWSRFREAFTHSTWILCKDGRMWSLTKLATFGTVACLTSVAAWAATLRDNHVYFALTGVQNFAFQSSEHSIHSKQPWAGVSSGVSSPGAQAFILVKAGRKGSSAVAGWFKERVGGGQTLVCNSRGNMPGELNFAVKGTMTFDVAGQTISCPNILIGQGHYATANNWWIGGPQMTGAHLSFTGATAQVCRVSGQAISAVVTFTPQTPCSNNFNIAVARANNLLPK